MYKFQTTGETFPNNKNSAELPSFVLFWIPNLLVP